MNLNFDFPSFIPFSVNMFTSVLVVILAGWFKWKTLKAETESKEEEAHVKQIDSMIDQIKLLSTELDKARNQLTELHAQNISLMSELRTANKRIGELEKNINDK